MLIHKLIRGGLDRIPDPSIADIETAIDSLDNTVTVGVSVSTLAGQISIGGGNEGRVVLYYLGKPTGQHKQWGKLLDSTRTDSDEMIEILVDNGQVDINPLYETVTKQMAKDVTRHFIEYGIFPSHLDWRGDMTKSTKYD